eukprot:scaffold19144_cov118-Isochrysis_galbana.AAC.5
MGGMGGGAWRWWEGDTKEGACRGPPRGMASNGPGRATLKVPSRPRLPHCPATRTYNPSTHLARGAPRKQAIPAHTQSRTTPSIPRPFPSSFPPSLPSPSPTLRRRLSPKVECREVGQREEAEREAAVYRQVDARRLVRLPPEGGWGGKGSGKGCVKTGRRPEERAMGTKPQRRSNTRLSATPSTHREGDVEAEGALALEQQPVHRHVQLHRPSIDDELLRTGALRKHRQRREQVRDGARVGRVAAAAGGVGGGGGHPCQQPERAAVHRRSGQQLAVLRRDAGHTMSRPDRTGAVAMPASRRRTSTL